MVDRIVPATTAEDVAALGALLGVEDQAMVKTEPFLQWVIEDQFCGPRPDFGPGVQVTAAVAPWEEAKLRLLNGAHSGIAYLGGLAGIDHVHEVLALPEARSFVDRLWDEAETTLSPPAELDVAAYRRDLEGAQEAIGDLALADAPSRSITVASRLSKLARNSSKHSWYASLCSTLVLLVAASPAASTKMGAFFAQNCSNSWSRPVSMQCSHTLSTSVPPSLPSPFSSEGMLGRL